MDPVRPEKSRKCRKCPRKRGPEMEPVIEMECLANSVVYLGRAPCCKAAHAERVASPGEGGVEGGGGGRGRGEGVCGGGHGGGAAL